jgi:hypothetical protein
MAYYHGSRLTVAHLTPEDPHGHIFIYICVKFAFNWQAIGSYTIGNTRMSDFRLQGLFVWAAYIKAMQTPYGQRVANFLVTELDSALAIQNRRFHKLITNCHHSSSILPFFAFDLLRCSRPVHLAMAPFDTLPIKSLPAPRTGNIIARSYQPGSMDRHTIIDIIVVMGQFVFLQSFGNESGQLIAWSVSSLFHFPMAKPLRPFVVISFF